MDVVDANTAWEDRAFYFCGKLSSPVVAKIWHFRSEDEYDSAEQPELLAVALIQKFAKCIGKRPFLLLASDPEASSALRSKKGVLWDHKELRQLPHVRFEKECEHGDTRLGALVDLSEFGFDSSASALLNWGRGLIVLATESLECLKEPTEQWISTDADAVLAFDYDAIGVSLRQHASSGILRYLPPSNSRLETIVVIADESLVDEGTCECICSIT